MRLYSPKLDGRPERQLYNLLVFGGRNMSETKKTSVDLIIKNAKIYTVNKKQPWATALAVKDGKFVYVGQDAGLTDFEGPVKDAGGKFIIPGLIDAHCHIGHSIRNTVVPPSTMLKSTGKKDILEEIRTHIEANPGKKEYLFSLSVEKLDGETLRFEDIDSVCKDVPVRINEQEMHSIWCNTKYFKSMGIDEYAPDMSPGYCIYERDPDGRINGRIYEMCMFLDKPELIDENVYISELDKFFAWANEHGIVAFFDAGVLGCFENAEQYYKVMSEYDKTGKLNQYVEAALHIVKPYQVDHAIDTLKEFGKKYDTEHFRIDIMKIQTDGTFNGRTACVTEPYLDNGLNGGTLIPYERLEQFMMELNAEGIDFHLHSIGDKTVHMILDAVECCKNKLGDDWKIQVTVAHVEQTPDEDLGRFAELGVNVDFTPFWAGGITIGGGIDAAESFLGYERAHKMYRFNSVYNTGAVVTFSSDTISMIMPLWNPYLGMEVGMTRQLDTENILINDFRNAPVYPPVEERMSLAQMISGYTINAAKRMRLDDKIGSIEVGKDASFNIFANNLFELDPYEIHKQLPEEFYIRGVKQ